MALTILCALLSWSASVVAKDEDSVRARLDRGEVVQKKQGRDGQAVNAVVMAVVDAPPEHVWAVVSDCTRYAETMYRVKAARLLEQKGNHWICELTVELPGPLPDLVSVTDAVHTVGKGRWERKWTLVRGDYEKNDGSWLLGAFDKEGTRTLIVYRAVVKPKIPIPQAIINWAQTSTVTEVINKLREAVRKYRVGLSQK